MNVLFIQFFSEILQRRPSTVLNVLYNHFVPIVENHQQLTDFTVQLSSLWAEGSRSTLCVGFFFPHCPQFCYLLPFWLLLHGCAVCKLMEVILCKLLPQFFVFSRKKITSINENIFSFFYKRCPSVLYLPSIYNAWKFPLLKKILCMKCFIHILERGLSCTWIAKIRSINCLNMNLTLAAS